MHGTSVTVDYSFVWYQSRPCSGCGTAYLTSGASPQHPHNEAECVAFKRGYEAGLLAGAPGYDRGFAEGKAAAAK